MLQVYKFQNKYCRYYTPLSINRQARTCHCRYMDCQTCRPKHGTTWEWRRNIRRHLAVGALVAFPSYPTSPKLRCRVKRWSFNTRSTQWGKACCWCVRLVYLCLFAASTPAFRSPTPTNALISCMQKGPVKEWNCQLGRRICVWQAVNWIGVATTIATCYSVFRGRSSNI